MELEFFVSEPWDFEGFKSRDMPKISLRLADNQSDDDVWAVWILSGWNPPSTSVTANLRPRYHGESLALLREGKTIIANLVRFDLGNADQARGMVSGSVRLEGDISRVWEHSG